MKNFKTKITIITIDLYRNTAISCFIFTGAILINKINISSSLFGTGCVKFYSIFYLSMSLCSLKRVPVVAYSIAGKKISTFRGYSISSKKVVERSDRGREITPALDPHFVTGIVDAEGCFHVSITKNKRLKLGLQVRLFFEIGLNEKDKALLEQIKIFFRVGSIIYYEKTKSFLFLVSSTKDFQNIIDHFKQFPLITQKWADFELWKQVYYIMLRGEHLTIDGFQKIVAIRAAMNWGLSEKLQLAFPDVVPVERPNVELPQIIDPHWLAGFSSGEGCFYINIFKDKTITGYTVRLVFQITQHSRDEKLISRIRDYLNCGHVSKNRKAIYFRVSKFKDIVVKIIPFFSKHPIVGVKALDFADFCKVAKMMRDNKHLSKEGLEKIQKIKAGMNRGRKFD